MIGVVNDFVFYPKNSIHEILSASTEISTATEIMYRLENEWRKRLRQIFIAITTGILLVGLIGAGVSYYLLDQKKEQQEVSLLTSVKAISKLATVQHQYSEAWEWKDQKDLLFFQLEKSILATGTATILAGIDLEKSELGLEKKGNIVKVVFPHAEILSVESELQFKGEQDVIFQRISPQDRNQLIQHAKENFRQKALDTGIIDQAEKKATAQIQSFLETLGYQAEVSYR